MLERLGILLGIGWSHRLTDKLFLLIYHIYCFEALSLLLDGTAQLDDLI